MRAPEPDARAPEPDAPARAMPAWPPRAPVLEVPLANSAMHAPVVKALLIAFGGILCAAVFTFGFLLLMALFSIWGSPVDVPAAVIPGVVIAVGSVGVAIWVLVTQRRPMLRITDDALTLIFPGFRRPFVVARTNVRVVSFDDRPVALFNANERFPVQGDVPPETFVDPLDRLGLGVPPVVYASVPSPSNDAPIEDPDAGWAMVDSVPLLIARASERGWLYRPDGSALPLYRIAQHDVPNIAVVFKDPMRSPHTWTPSVLHRTWHHRMIPGMMLRLATTLGARAALAGWEEQRDVTADDVLDMRLQLPKPLRGWRILVFAVIVLAPLLVRVLSRA